MVKLRESPDDLFFLMGEASRRLGIPLAQIEKDYWAVELLRTVTQPVDGGRVVFKGGTSLSKGFGLIERFSEDVDILLVPDPSFGKGRVDGLLKTIADRAAFDLELPAEVKSPTKGIKRNVRFSYPVSYPSEDVTEGVLLEMGVRGGSQPTRQVTVSSYVGDTALGKDGTLMEHEDLIPVSIEALAPERTLIEKLALTHDLSTRYDESNASFGEQGRHIYDIWGVLDDESVRSALAEPGFAAKIAEDRERISAYYGFPTTPRPEGGFAASPTFDERHPCAGAWQEAYDRAMALVWGVKPTLADCRSRVLAYRDLL